MLGRLRPWTKAPSSQSWISDADARTFLGLNPPAAEAKFNDRWYISGKYQRDELPSGFWLSVESVSRWSAMGPVTESYSVTPSSCLIPWRIVLTMQPADGTVFSVEPLKLS